VSRGTRLQRAHMCPKRRRHQLRKPAWLLLLRNLYRIDQARRISPERHIEMLELGTLLPPQPLYVTLTLGHDIPTIN
jgi:hypothetical protein